jgi:nucleoside-diphosphate-sugar epimerase
VRALYAQGAEVTVVDDFSTGSADNLTGMQGLKIETVDVRERPALLVAMAGAELVFHLAALSSVPGSLDQPGTTHDVDATGTLNVLRVARELNVRRVVYSSSTAVYGVGGTVPIVEPGPTRPLSPYGASKLAGEAYTLAFNASYGLETIALRYFNVFGPGQPADSAYAAVIPRFIKAYLGNESPIINGDGEQTRDFIYVDDVVRANLAAASAGADALGKPFNIGTGVELSINALAESLRVLTASDRHPLHRPAAEGEIRRSFADVEAARRDLGFSATVSFEEGLRHTLAWWTARTAA